MHSDYARETGTRNELTPAPVDVEGLAIQRDLMIGAVDDPLEAEADAMADRVMRMPEVPRVQRKCAECEEEDEAVRRKPLASQVSPFIQTKAAEGSATTSAGIARAIDQSRGGGSALPGPTRSFMETRFEADFSNVRVHADAEAARLSRDLAAKAFTVGEDIYFNAREYAPESTEGDRLLAHELTHTLQQRKGSRGAVGQRKVGDGHDLVSPRMKSNKLFQDIFDNTAVMEVGDRGPEVRRVQQMLIDLGIPFPVFGADGKFGDETRHAVIAYQHRKGLDEDGRVGFATIGALDLDFPAFALPGTKGDPWTLPCVLDILCPWNKNLVENVLPNFDIVTFDSRTFPVHTWDGTKWVDSTFDSGGFRSGTNMGFLNTTTCEEMAFTIYHEGWHGQQPSSLTGVVETERDAYVNAEQWSIDVGIPGQPDFVNAATGAAESFRTTRAGETVVNEPAAERFVRQEYGGVSAVPGERILARVGASDVRVLRPDGSIVVRAANAGESVRDPVSMTNLNHIPKASWVCP